MSGLFFVHSLTANFVLATNRQSAQCKPLQFLQQILVLVHFSAKLYIFGTFKEVFALLFCIYESGVTGTGDYINVGNGRQKL